MPFQINNLPTFHEGICLRCHKTFKDTNLKQPYNTFKTHIKRGTCRVSPAPLTVPDSETEDAYTEEPTENTTPHGPLPSRHQDILCPGCNHPFRDRYNFERHACAFSENPQVDNGFYVQLKEIDSDSELAKNLKSTEALGVLNVCLEQKICVPGLFPSYFLPTKDTRRDKTPFLQIGNPNGEQFFTAALRVSQL